jgi:hypothetical protein
VSNEFDLEFQEFARIGRRRSDGARLGAPQAGQIADHLQLFQIARKPSSDRWVGSERRSENSPPQGRMMTLVRRQTMALARKARSANAMQRFAVTIRNGIGAVRSAIDKQTDESIN